VPAKATPTDQLAATAITGLGSTPLRTSGPAGHFPISTRLRRGRLVQPWHDTAAGGPIRLLDLDAMRTARAGTRTGTAGTSGSVSSRAPGPPSRSGNSPTGTAPNGQVQASPRPSSTTWPSRGSRDAYLQRPTQQDHGVATSHLEAFQAGAHAYAHLGLLSAVPADGMLTLDGRYLAAASGRLADQLSYLDSAQGHLSTSAPVTTSSRSATA